MVTGESLPVHKQARAARSSERPSTATACCAPRATGVGSDTALAQIVKLVQEAQNSKAPGQRLADRAAFWLVFVALDRRPIDVRSHGRCSPTSPADEALLYAITVVVITCPDALGLATPTAIMVGSGLGAHRGVLFKNASAIETAARIDVVVMDKTGTLTKGQPEVTDLLFAEGVDETEVIALAAAVERLSEHPIAQAYVEFADARGRAALERRSGLRERPRAGRHRHRRRPTASPSAAKRSWTAQDIDLAELAQRMDTARHRGPHRHVRRDRRHHRCGVRRRRRPA